MQQVISVIVHLARKLSPFIVLPILFFAFFVRHPYVTMLRCDYLSDCGRDILAAKHIADGTASLLTSPASAVSLLSNTPLYYWILAVLYKMGGLLLISYFNVVVGVLVVWLTYLIVFELTQKITISWFAAVFVAMLPSMINASVTTWQPHWQFFFGCCSILLCLRALRTSNLIWHYFAVASLWPLLYLEYLALPVIAIMTAWLGWSALWVAQQKKQRKPAFGLIGMLALMWIVWISFVISLNPSGGAIELENLVDQKNFSVFAELIKLQELAKIITQFFTDQIRYFWFWQWLLALPIFAGIYRWQMTQDLTKKTQIAFLLSLLSPLILGLFLPNDHIFGWHFLLQQYCFFICMVLLPHFLKLSTSTSVVFLLILFFTLTYQNRFQLKHLASMQGPTLQHAVILAKIIATDVQAQGINVTQFRLVHRSAQPPEWMKDTSADNLDILARNYETAGVQLELEIIDPRFAARVAIVPLRQWWSNYLQPSSETYYVICTNYSVSVAEDCVDEVFLDNFAIVQKNNLGIVQLTPSRSVFVYRLRLESKTHETIVEESDASSPF